VQTRDDRGNGIFNENGSLSGIPATSICNDLNRMYSTPLPSYNLRKMFCTLDVRRQSIVTSALSYDNGKIVVRYFVNRVLDSVDDVTLWK